MTKEECIKGLKYLSLAYGTDGFTPDECNVYYEFLQGYSYDTFRAAVKNIIRKSKFLPKITELIEECNNAKTTMRFDVIEYMNKRGYFKHHREYEKASSFMERGIVPEWLQKDMNKYYREMINNRLEYQEQILIGD